MIIGLTGGIASGKSTVSTMIKQLGIKVIDADIIAREVVEKGEKAYEEIVEGFGNDIVGIDGSLDRKKLGAIVFNDEKKRLLLNEIVHPAIRKKMQDQIEFYKEAGQEPIVLDIPLLFESNLTYLVDKILLIFVNEEIQLDRLKVRDDFSHEEAIARVESQMPLKEKIKLADEIIHNDGLLQETRNQLITILKKWNCI